MPKQENILTIIYGSRTGNTKAVAELAHNYAISKGFKANITAMPDFDMTQFSSIQNLLVLVSTHGEGEPPVQAESFYEYLQTNELKMQVNYAILGLGDSSYRYFCQTGKDIDQRMEAFGGKRIFDVGTADIDFEDYSKDWVRGAVDAYDGILEKAGPLDPAFIFELKLDDGEGHAYRATLKKKIILSSEESSKKVMHVELDIPNAPFEYQPGDAIGIYSTNSKLFVDALLKQLQFDPTHGIEGKNGPRLLKDALIHDYELTLLTPIVMEKYNEYANNKVLNSLLRNKDRLSQYLLERDIMDLVLD